MGMLCCGYFCTQARDAAKLIHDWPIFLKWFIHKGDRHANRKRWMMLTWPVFHFLHHRVCAVLWGIAADILEEGRAHTHTNTLSLTSPALSDSSSAFKPTGAGGTTAAISDSDENIPLPATWGHLGYLCTRQPLANCRQLRFQFSFRVDWILT